MKLVIQRVQHAKVVVDEKVVGAIGRGALILLGIMKGDGPAEVEYLVDKVAHFRMFPDQRRRMHYSLLDIKGEVLVVSQFTLAADGHKGRRPSFDNAAAPEQAIRLYESFIQQLRAKGLQTQTGIFGAYMAVELLNDGPVTFVLERPPKTT